MATKKCVDPYGYGCECVVEYEEEAELVEKFRFVCTHSGDYFRNACRACENRRARELRQQNYKSYNWSKRNKQQYDPQDYGRLYGGKN